MNNQQGILGTSGKRPFFRVDHDTHEETYTIWYGLSPFLTIPDQKNSVLFKTAVSILLNASVKPAYIQRELGISQPTIRKIHEIFSFKDENAILSGLRTPGRTTYKMTEEIAAFMKKREEYYEEKGRKYYHKKIAEDVMKKFNVSLNPQKIRDELKKEAKKVEETTEEAGKVGTEKEHPVSLSEPEETPDLFECSYAGAMLVHGELEKAVRDMPEPKVPGWQTLKASVIAWIIMIVIGCRNLEGMRYLRKKDFAFICGGETGTTRDTVRGMIKKLSIIQDTKIAGHLLRHAVQQHAVQNGDYYIDGHMKEYTGVANILSGWNTKKNRTTKGVFHYFIHDVEGNPLGSQILDNFHDFRDVLRDLKGRIDAFPGPRKKTLIFDRGGFSIPVIKDLCKDPNWHFITWQKGFKAEESDGKKFNGTARVEYPYNTPGTYRKYDMKYCEDKYERKGYGCRRIIISRRTGRREIRQALLTSDQKTSGERIIIKLLKRFAQENDFKKQGRHFGLNEIVTYDKLPFDKLKEKPPGKMVLTRKAEAIREAMLKLKGERKRLHTKLGKAVENGSDHNAASRETIRTLARIDLKITRMKKKLERHGKKISRLERTKKDGYIELDLRKKRIVEMMNITGRNAVEKEADELLATYGNLRDYQQIMRKLLATPGTISVQDGIMEVSLERFGEGSMQKAVEKYLEKVNKRGMRTINGRYVLRFKLKNEKCRKTA